MDLGDSLDRHTHKMMTAFQLAGETVAEPGHSNDYFVVDGKMESPLLW